MMKQKLRFILAGALAVALAVAWLLVINDQDPGRTQQLFRPARTEEISRIEIKNSYGDFQFYQDDQGWLVSDGTGSYLTNAEKMRLLTDSLLHFKVLRLLETEQPEYGTDQPRAAVQFETNQGRQFLVLVGNSCPNSAESYAKAGGLAGTIITDAASVAQLTGSLSAYRTNDVFSIDLGQLQSLEYSAGGEKKLGFYREEGGAWALDYPFSAGARKLEISEFLAAMSQWRIADYPERFKPASGGGDESLRITDTSGRSQTIQLGAVEGALRYARIGGQEDVVALYTSDVDLSVLRPEALVYETPLYESINNVSSVYMNIGGSTIQAEIDAQAGVVKIDGRLVDYEAFTGVYYRYVLLLADGWDADPKPGEPVAQFISTLKDGGERTLTLYERDEESLYMEYGKGQGFYLELRRLQQLCDRLEELG